MKEENNIQNDDEQMRQLIRPTRLKVPKNLNYRIMQQIETEKVFSAKPVVKKNKLENTVKDLAATTLIMNVMIALLTITAYIMYGKDYLLSSPFLSTILIIILVFTLFWLFSRLDARLQKKQINKASRQNHVKPQG
ncbi:MAG: hypothetical protein WCR12_01500 [Dysgonamonadaceae bacterium]